MNNIYLIILICCYSLSTLNAQPLTTEISKEFKTVVRKIAKEEFKKFVNTKISESDPLLGATTYDLIDNIVAGESIEIIHDNIINTIIDYGSLLLIEDIISAQITSIKNRLFKKTSNVSLSDDEFNRIKYLSSLYVFEGIANKNILPIGNHMTELLYANDSFLKEIYLVEGVDTLDVRDYLADYMIDNGVKLNRVLNEALIFKINAKQIYYSRRADLTTITAKFSDVDSSYSAQLNKLNELVQDYIGHIRTYSLNSNTKYKNIIEFCLPYFRNIFIKKEFIFDVSDKIFVKNLTNLIYKIYSDYEAAYSYEIGLWSGYYFKGPSWAPESIRYPLLSFKINDRIQYKLISNDQWSGFVFIGGFFDYAIKEASKSKNNTYLLFGVGASYGRASIMGTAGYPLNAPGVTTFAGIISLSYDLPIQQIIDSLIAE